MTRDPDFDELVGTEPVGRERDRLRRTHELLLAAGPPPELRPEIEAGPTLSMTLARRPRQGRGRQRLALLAAAVAAVAVVFLGGYIVGNHGAGPSTQAVRTIELRGTSAAPAALASLRIGSEDVSGNWPMTLDVTGLPALPEGGRYALYLIRQSREWEPCGWFTVSGPHTGATLHMTVPYDLHAGDTWVVTRQAADTSGRGVTVMRPNA